MNERLAFDGANRFWLASPLAFADWRNPTAAEMNANPTNAPSGLIFELTCALDTDGTQFDLDESELDDSLSFCQDSSTQNPISQGATIVYSFFRAKERWTNAATPTAANGFNTANLALSLLTYRGVEYFAIMGQNTNGGQGEPVEEGDILKLAEVVTDWGVDEADIGGVIRMTQEFGKRTRLAWNREVAA